MTLLVNPNPSCTSSQSLCFFCTVIKGELQEQQNQLHFKRKRQTNEKRETPEEFVVSFTSRFCWSESCRICSPVSFSAENIHFACCCAALKSLGSRHEERRRGRERLGGGRTHNISMNTALQAGLNRMSITRRLEGSNRTLDRWRAHSQTHQGDQADVWRMESFSCGQIGGKPTAN